MDGECPIFQNFTAKSTNDKYLIKKNLINQLTGPVRWTQIMENMIKSQLSEVIEVGPGKILQGLFKKINRELPTQSASL